MRAGRGPGRELSVGAAEPAERFFGVRPVEGPCRLGVSPSRPVSAHTAFVDDGHGRPLDAGLHLTRSSQRYGSTGEGVSDTTCQIPRFRTAARGSHSVPTTSTRLCSGVDTDGLASYGKPSAMPALSRARRAPRRRAGPTGPACRELA